MKVQLKLVRIFNAASSSNFEIQKYYKNETKLNGVYSRKNLPKIKDGAYAINLDEYKSTVCINQQMYVNGDNGSLSYNAFYFDSFGEVDTFQKY